MTRPRVPRKSWPQEPSPFPPNVIARRVDVPNPFRSDAPSRAYLVAADAGDHLVLGWSMTPYNRYDDVVAREIALRRLQAGHLKSDLTGSPDLTGHRETNAWKRVPPGLEKPLSDFFDYVLHVVERRRPQ